MVANGSLRRDSDFEGFHCVKVTFHSKFAAIFHDTKINIYCLYELFPNIIMPIQPDPQVCLGMVARTCADSRMSGERN